MKVVLGLGNPGKRYEETRHNLGHRAVHLLAQTHGVRLTTREGACLTGTGSLEGIPVLLALTEIVMNRSGKAVADLLARRHLGPEDLLLLHDDLDLQPGRIKIKIRGRHGGHHGVESVITHVGTEAFLRIKIGIGKVRGVDPEEYVLSPCTRDELPLINEALKRAAEAIVTILTRGVPAAMNIHHC